MYPDLLEALLRTPFQQKLQTEEATPSPASIHILNLIMLSNTRVQVVQLKEKPLNILGRFQMTQS